VRRRSDPRRRRWRPPGFETQRADRLEHQTRDRASSRSQPLGRSSDPAVRAGALLRLGRNQRNAGQIDAALATYRELGAIDSIAESNLPVGLVAVVAQAEILRAAGRIPEFRGGPVLRSRLAAGACRAADACSSIRPRRALGGPARMPTPTGTGGVHRLSAHVRALGRTAPPDSSVADRRGRRCCCDRSDPRPIRGHAGRSRFRTDGALQSLHVQLTDPDGIPSRSHPDGTILP
jgi:hypothetical protein